MSDYSYTLVDPVNPGWGNLNWRFRVDYSNGAKEYITVGPLAGQDKAEIALRQVVDDEFHVRPSPPPDREPRPTRPREPDPEPGGGGGRPADPFPGGHN